MFFAHYNVKLSNTWHDKQKVFHPLCIVKIRHGNRDILCFRSNFVTYISFSTCLFICVIISLHSQSDSNRSSRAPKLHGSRFPGLERSVPILHGLHPCCLSQQILLGKKMCSKKCVFFPTFCLPNLRFDACCIPSERYISIWWWIAGSFWRFKACHFCQNLICYSMFIKTISKYDRVFCLSEGPSVRWRAWFTYLLHHQQKTVHFWIAFLKSHILCVDDM